LSKKRKLIPLALFGLIDLSVIPVIPTMTLWSHGSLLMFNYAATNTNNSTSTQ